MSSIKQIENDLSQAIKDKNQLALLTLRGIKTALTNAEIAKNRQELTEAEELKVLKTEVKRRQEAAELYEKGNRPELAKKELDEIVIIKKYLPQDLDPEKIREIVKGVIAELGATSPQDVGKTMGLVMAKLKGQADGNIVSKIVQEELKILK